MIKLRTDMRDLEALATHQPPLGNMEHDALAAHYLMKAIQASYEGEGPRTSCEAMAWVLRQVEAKLPRAER